MSLILASASPRRKEIMQTAGLIFSIHVSDTDETLPDGIAASEAVTELSYRKALAVAKTHPDDTVIGADTVVTLDGKILGKPANTDDAKNMLRTLSGRTHKVFTGVCIIKGDCVNKFFEETDVTFFDLTDEEINAYVETNEPMDKAGAYGIQGKGCTLVKGICGDYFNVVGLPVARLVKELKNSEN